MQVQQTCTYYPYSPLATASIGADSNNSSPESVHAEYRPFVQQQQQQQQRSHQLMDLSSPVSAHQHAHHQHHHHQPQQHHHQQVHHARRQHQNYEEQFYGQELDTYDSGMMNGSYVAEQQRHWHQQPPQQQTINRYPGYSSPPAVNFVQQQQQQVYAQPQLSPRQQLTVNAQLPHQVYTEPATTTYPFAGSVPNFAPQQQPIAAAVGKQRVVTATAVRAKNSKRKRKATAGDDDDGVAKMAKLEVPPPPPMSACEDESAERLTASMRERQRTQELNSAYSQLRQTIPCLPSDKLSKIQTVRLATKYIEFLFRVLQFNAMPEAVRHAHASPKTAVLASALEIVESTKMSPNPVPSHEKLSYAFSVWRMDNEMTGTTRVE